MRKTMALTATLAFVLGVPVGLLPALADDHKSTEQPNVRKTDLPFKGLRVAVLTGEGFQDAEALMPIAFLTNRGAAVTVIGPQRGTVKAYNSDVQLLVHKSVADVAAGDFDLLVLPGGAAPDKIRRSADVVKFTRDFVQLGRPVAAICHGPQVLVTADVVQGRKMTCYRGMADELKDAGAIYEDQEVMRDGQLVTSRVPQDIPAWLSTIETLVHESLKPAE
jgi:protease I